MYIHHDPNFVEQRELINIVSERFIYKKTEEFVRI